MVVGPATGHAGAMNTTPPEAPSGPPPQQPAEGPRVDRDQVRDLGRLRRSVTDRKVAGVAGGLARHLDVDPLVLRVLFVVLAFFGGAGLILYGALWLLVPEDGSNRASINLDERSRTAAIVIVGAIAALLLIGDSWGAFWFPWPLAVIALLALWLVTRNSPAPADYAQAPAGPAAPAQSAPRDQPDQPEQYSGQGDAPTYPQGYYPQQPQTPAYVAPVRPPNPRRRGPVLFWFTLALIALCEGLLGMVDLAGADVVPSAYPALAVAISGVMLLVGAFFGRAGGIILVGLVATLALGATTAADEWEGDHVTVSPVSASSLAQRYWLDAGEQVVDLRDVADVDQLDGRRLEIEGGVGRIEVILPDDLAAVVNADIDGPGHVVLFGEEHGGIDVSESSQDGSVDDPRITIDTHLGVGEIEVHR